MSEKNEDSMKDRIAIRIEPDLSQNELWEFYIENNCCETRYGKEQATKVIAGSDFIVTARECGRLVGIARAVSDGNDAKVLEISVANSHQDSNVENDTGALVEDDFRGVGHALSAFLIEELKRAGISWVDAVAYEGELPFYLSSGWQENVQHRPMFQDFRSPWIYTMVIKPENQAEAKQMICCELKITDKEIESRGWMQSPELCLCGLYRDDLVAACFGAQSEKDASIAELRGIVVDNNERRKGYGKQLLAKFELQAKKLGYTEVNIEDLERFNKGFFKANGYQKGMKTIER